MRINGPVLVATALDAAGDEAVRQAAELARLAGVSLVACHVLPEVYGIRPLFPQLREADRVVADATRARIAAVLEQRVRAHAGPAGAAAAFRVEAGTPHSEVLRAADECAAGLVVVGSGSHGAGASLGGVAERIVRHAAVPVLVARPGTRGAVLAATDFSDPALPAIEAGRDEAKRRARPFAIVHAVELRMLPMEAAESAPTLVAAGLIDAETRRAQADLAQVAREYGASEPIVRVGPPAQVVLEEASRLEADLVVVGTHGHSGLRRLTLGSVAESVVRAAGCSVLVVRLAG